jgi:hypothetical protein
MSRISEALAVTAELCGTDLSTAAASVLAEELSAYDERLILGALARVRRELKGRLTMAAILERIDDGRPGPDEAWAMIPRSEAESVVWTDEMSECWGALDQIADGPAKRAAFIERYRRAVADARDAGRPVRWTPSLGWDASGRDAALEQAVQMGRLSREHAADLLPAPINVVPIEAMRAMTNKMRAG